MGVLARDNRQFTLIYSSNTRVGTHVLAYAQAMEDKLLAIDIAKTKVADTEWAELAEKMGCKVGDLIDKRLVDVEDTSEFSTDDWLKILQHNDKVLSHPIAINGNRTRQIDNASEVLRFFGVDSAGLEKTMYTEEPTTENKTKGENFIE